MTGPQSMLLAGSDGYTDDPQYGEQTGEWIAGNQRAAAQGCTERLIAEAQAAAAEIAEPRHTRKRRFHLPRLRRRQAPAPAVSALLAAPVLPVSEQAAHDALGAGHAIDVAARFAEAYRQPVPEVSPGADMPTWGYVAPDQLEHGARHEPAAAEAAAERALEWGPWDTAEHREPMEPGGPPCRCDEHKYGQRPGAGVVLYAGPDVVETSWLAALRDGRYEDIDAYADLAEMRIEAEFEAHERNAWRTIESGKRRVAAVLRGAA